MASASNKSLLLVLSLLSVLAFNAHAQLSTTFYAKSCPNVEKIVRSVMAQAIAKEPRMGASILRLLFHDCFVQCFEVNGPFCSEKEKLAAAYMAHLALDTKVKQKIMNCTAQYQLWLVPGCDASILLDNGPGISTEKNAFGNVNSARGFEVIDAIKVQVERQCKATVSCADILALAARDSVNLLGGPNWSMPLGRRDSRTANLAEANNLPAPFESLSQLTTRFAAKGLNAKDLIVLSGAHTVGFAICSAFKSRVWGGDRNINPSFALSSRQTCPANGGDTILTPLTSPNTNKFGNQFFKNLVAGRGLLHSDQELFNGRATDAFVKTYSTDASAFSRDFPVSMVKMGNIGVLTGRQGEVRLNCRKVN